MIESTIQELTAAVQELTKAVRKECCGGCKPEPKKAEPKEAEPKKAEPKKAEPKKQEHVTEGIKVAEEPKKQEHVTVGIKVAEEPKKVDYSELQAAVFDYVTIAGRDKAIAALEDKFAVKTAKKIPEDMWAAAVEFFRNEAEKENV